jgi:hypothetical protein
MKHSRITNPVPILAGLLISLSFGTFGFSLDISAPPDSHAGRGFTAAYDAAHEITVTGNVEEVFTKHIAGSPAGMHLWIAGPQGRVDAHLGPFLSKDTRDALHAGTPVQIVGAMETLHGKQILLARQLIFGGRIVTIRSPHGLLVRTQVRRAASSRSGKAARTGSNGGSL